MSTTIGRSTSGLFLGFVFLAFVAGMGFALVFLRLSPVIILGLTVSTATIAISAFRPYIGVHVIVAMVFFEGAVTAIEGVTALRVFGLLLLAGWLAKALTERRLRVDFGKQTLFLAAYLVWSGFCVTRASDFDEAISRVGTYILLAITAFMIGSVVDTTDRLRRLLVSMTLWIAVAAAIGVLMYYAGFTQVAEGLVRNRNQFALYLNVGLAGAFLMQSRAKSAIIKMALVLSIPMMMLAIALTLSRTGLIVMLLTLVIVGYRLLRERGLVLLLGGAVAVFALAFLLPAAFWSRAGTILPSIERKQDTFGMRVRLWEAGLRMVEDRPIFGVGPANFRQGLSRYTRGGMSSVNLNAHNVYVVVAAETGLPGLALFLGFIISGFVAVHRVARDALRAGREDLATYAFLVEVAIIILMATGVTMTVEGLKVLWVVLGLGLAVVGLGRSELRATAADAPRLALPASPGTAPV